jgi:hypothetical protein
VYPWGRHFLGVCLPVYRSIVLISTEPSDSTRSDFEFVFIVAVEVIVERACRFPATSHIIDCAGGVST